MEEKLLTIEKENEIYAPIETTTASIKEIINKAKLELEGKNFLLCAKSKNEKVLFIATLLIPTYKNRPVDSDFSYLNCYCLGVNKNTGEHEFISVSSAGILIQNDFIHVLDLNVEDSFKNLGIGSAMLQFLNDYAVENKLKGICLESEIKFQVVTEEIPDKLKDKVKMYSLEGVKNKDIVDINSLFYLKNGFDFIDNKKIKEIKVEFFNEDGILPMYKMATYNPIKNSCPVDSALIIIENKENRLKVK